MRNTSNAEHYVWGNGCDGWRLLAGDDLAVTQERIPPGEGEVTHYHAKARQLFFVLKGALQISVESDSVTLGAGDALEIPPLRRHRVWNPTGEDVHFLVISAPTTHGDRVNAG